MIQAQIDAPRSAVAIMAKAPNPGQVKTRLCPPLTHEVAAALYRCFLLDKIAQVSALQGIAPVLSYDSLQAKPMFEALTPSHFLLIPQLGDDLGARLRSTFDQLFALGFTQVMAIDSDTPTLPTLYLAQAVTMLTVAASDIVLGPTEDGGYYLIGLRRSHGGLFEHMPWSTSQVFSETMHRAERSGLKVSCTAGWYDVDTPDDLLRLKAFLEQAEDGPAWHTRRFLREFRW